MFSSTPYERPRLGEFLLRDCGGSGPEEAAHLYGTYLRDVVFALQLSSKLVIGICAEAEKLWAQACTDIKRLEMEDAVCFMLIAFGAGLRGEEVPSGKRPGRDPPTRGI